MFTVCKFKCFETSFTRYNSHDSIQYLIKYVKTLSSDYFLLCLQFAVVAYENEGAIMSNFKIPTFQRQAE